MGRVVRLAVIFALALSAGGCGLLNPNALWGDEEPCIITHTICGTADRQWKHAVELVAEGSYWRAPTDEWLSRQEPAVRASFEADVWAQEADRDEEAVEESDDLTRQMWWRSEDDNLWDELGVDND